MSRPAVILAHPVMLTSPDKITELEQETGMKCQRAGALAVQMVPLHDGYEQTDRQSWLGQIGAFAGDAA